MKKTESNTACTIVHDALKSHDFTTWKGLQTDCSFSNLQKILPAPNEGVASGYLGQEKKHCTYKTFNVANALLLRVWFRADTIERIDVEFPDIDNPSKQFESWEQPDAQLDYTFGGVQMLLSEWVYAQKGIAVLYNSDRTKLTKIVLFSAMTIEAYTKKIRVNTTIREIEERE